MTGAIHDLRQAFRTLARHPGSTALIAGLLALGIGACTLMFSLFDAVFLRPLPARQPARLVMLVQHIPKLGTRSVFPDTYYPALHDRATALEPFGETDWPSSFVMRDPAPAEEISLKAVTPNFFDALGVQALYGRVLLPSDAREGSGPPPAVLSYDFWRGRFGGNPDVVNGRSVLINKRYFAIVGVMPRDFNGLTVDTSPDVWIPLEGFPSIAGRPMEQVDLELDDRLKPGFTLLEAQAECRTIWQSSMKDYFKTVEKLPPREAQAAFRRGVALDPLARGTSTLRSTFGGALKILMASVCVLLLIVCSNVAGLLLARGATRQQEFAVRLAVGATRGRLVRQALAEGLVLAVLGSVGGLLTARAGVPLVKRMLPPMRDLTTTLVPLSIHLGINTQVLWFVLGLSLATMVLFSISPTVAVSRSKLDSLLRATRASTSVKGRQALIALQIALCTFLLAVAGLFLRTMEKLNRLILGWMWTTSQPSRET